MKFWHRKRLEIKYFKDETSSEYIFTEYIVMILTNFYSKGGENPIIMDKNSLYEILANTRC